MEIPKKYDAKKSEKKWQKFWEKNKIYKFDSKSKKKIYSIDTPPPTVSGEMHIGHASMYSQMDFIARYKRMRGFNLFYPFGTDDNGLATERLIERLKNVKNTEMSRDEFVKLCLKTLKEIRPKFIQDWKNIGISADYSVFYSTINEHSRKISQESFIELYEKGREYRKKGPTMWCPECHMAIAQVELEDRLLPSTFNDVVFKVDGKDFVIATTRPELLPSCVAVFYHPDDKRYKKLKGKKSKVPLFDLEVPIIPDERADPEKGTGLVMCCTFGDQTDIEWQKAHNLPIKISITEDGRMTGLAGKYKGLGIKEAREKIIEDLKKNELLVKQEKIQHTVNVHERCGTEIEILETKQWFIKYLDIKSKLLKAGAKLKWYPPFMKVRYDNWVKGLQWDWCISRQRHFGIPIPVWYCKKCGEIILADRKQLPVDPLNDKPLKKCKCGSTDFEPEKDVLDTWATSSLTPQISAKLFEKHYDKLYPMNLRPQSHDIITFWLFNTVVKSQLHNNVNPWKDVVISGFVLDPHGKKMSKSKGNIVKPQDIIEKYSADALRFWSSSVKLGDDIPYQEKDLVTANKTITKLWNASKFVFMHLKDFDLKKPKKFEVMDKWMLSKVNDLVKSCTESFEKYEYSKARADVDKFFWQVFCTNYLEIVKDRLYNPDERGDNARKSAQYVLYYSLLSILKIFAPIMPYITEEIYNLYYSKKEKEKSIHVSEWPEYNKKLKVDEKVGDEFIRVLEQVRKYKSRENKSLKEGVSLTLTNRKLEIVLDDLKAVTHSEITFGKKFKVGG